MLSIFKSSCSLCKRGNSDALLIFVLIFIPHPLNHLLRDQIVVMLQVLKLKTVLSRSPHSLVEPALKDAGGRPKATRDVIGKLATAAGDHPTPEARAELMAMLADLMDQQGAPGDGMVVFNLINDSSSTAAEKASDASYGMRMMEMLSGAGGSEEQNNAQQAQAPDGQDPPVNTLLYSQMPEHFTWQRQSRKWQRRQRRAARTAANSGAAAQRAAAAPAARAAARRAALRRRRRCRQAAARGARRLEPSALPPAPRLLRAARDGLSRGRGPRRAGKLPSYHPSSRPRWQLPSPRPTPSRQPWPCPTPRAAAAAPPPPPPPPTRRRPV